MRPGQSTRTSHQPERMNRSYARVKDAIKVDLRRRGYEVIDHSKHQLVIRKLPDPRTNRIQVRSSGTVEVQGDMHPPGDHELFDKGEEEPMERRARVKEALVRRELGRINQDKKLDLNTGDTFVVDDFEHKVVDVVHEGDAIVVFLQSCSDPHDIYTVRYTVTAQHTAESIELSLSSPQLEKLWQIANEQQFVFGEAVRSPEDVIAATIAHLIVTNGRSRNEDL